MEAERGREAMACVVGKESDIVFCCVAYFSLFLTVRLCWRREVMLCCVPCVIFFLASGVGDESCVVLFGFCQRS